MDEALTAFSQTACRLPACILYEFVSAQRTVLQTDLWTTSRGKGVALKLRCFLIVFSAHSVGDSGVSPDLSGSSLVLSPDMIK